MHPRAHKISFTKDGYEALQKEQVELLAKRPAAVAELKKAREMGDLSENGAYKGARFLLNQIDSRLRYIHHTLLHAEVIENTPKGIVGLDTKVVVTDGKEERIFHIVGEHEASPLEGKISPKSPIGSKLMGKKEGQEVAVELPKGRVVYTITKITS